jgi:hypothetical protein
MSPSWFNANGAPQTVGGALTSLTGPAGPTYTIIDGTAAYPTVPDGVSIACIDCYGISVTGAHGEAKRWTLHVGGTFADVATTAFSTASWRRCCTTA